jgi:hypothetical protein
MSSVAVCIWRAYSYLFVKLELGLDIFCGVGDANFDAASDAPGNDSFQSLNRRDYQPVNPPEVIPFRA